MEQNVGTDKDECQDQLSHMVKEITGLRVKIDDLTERLNHREGQIHGAYNDAFPPTIPIPKANPAAFHQLNPQAQRYEPRR